MKMNLCVREREKIALPSSGLMNNHLSFSRCIFIDLFTKGSSLHVAVWLRNVHRPVTADIQLIIIQMELGFLL